MQPIFLSLFHESNPEALWLLGFAYKYQDRFDEAIDIFKKGLEFNKRRALINYEIGEHL